MNAHPAPSSNGRPLALLLLVWFLIALAISLSGHLTVLKPPAPQVVIVVLTISALVAALSIPSLRAWADRGSIRAVVALHLTRFVGIYFLILGERGTLARSFAIPAGWGDIAVATLALILLVTVRPDTGPRLRWYAAWNVLGMLDILLVVTNAARLGLADPASMQPLLHLP